MPTHAKKELVAVSGALDTEQMIEYMRLRAGAFMRILDGSVEAIDQQRGWARLRWYPTEACCHSGTIVQGGFVTSMLDAAMAHAITAKVGVGMMAPTLELKVSFFRVCSPGVCFSEGRVVHSTRSIVFAEADLTDADGTPIARASATCKVAPLKG
jgi:acyl-CoA thioesterase